MFWPISFKKRGFGGELQAIRKGNITIELQREGMDEKCIGEGQSLCEDWFDGLQKIKLNFVQISTQISTFSNCHFLISRSFKIHYSLAFHRQKTVASHGSLSTQSVSNPIGSSHFPICPLWKLIGQNAFKNDLVPTFIQMPEIISM